MHCSGTPVARPLAGATGGDLTPAMAAAPAGGIRWPGGHEFAFTIFDDTDLTTLHNGPPVYELLTGLGLRITKSVWVTESRRRPGTVGGTTCADRGYADWVLSLQHDGHEIGFHNATDATSTRAETEGALDRFRDLFGTDPRCGANHAGNREAIYWGPARLSGRRAWLYDRLTHGQQSAATEGELATSDLFWGDLCRERVKYWRNFTFGGIDTLAAVPEMPYQDPDRPYVNQWFAATDASNAWKLDALLSVENVARLARSGGACIVYTHLGSGYWEGGRMHAGAADGLRRVADAGGWLAPVGDVLDHLAAERTHPVVLDDRSRGQLERRWLRHRIRDGLR